MGKKEWIELLFEVPSTTLAGIAVFCNIYVIYSTKKVKKKLSRQYHYDAKTMHDYILCHLIHWLGIIDIFFSIACIVDLGITPQLVTDDSTECVLIGFLSQFAGTASSLWRILISIYLFVLLVTDLNKSSNYQTSVVFASPTRNECMFNISIFTLIVLCFISAMIPLKYDGKTYYTRLYNYTDDNGYQYGAECWLKAYFQLIFYGLVSISIVFDIIVLLLAIYKYNQTKSFTSAYWVLIKRLFTWVCVFLIIRIIPFTDRCIGWIIGPNKYNAPLWLVLAHNYLLSSVGIANGIVWYFNRKTQPKFYAIKKGQHGGNMIDPNDPKNAPLIVVTDDDTKGDGSGIQMTPSSRAARTPQPTRWESFETDSAIDSRAGHGNNQYVEYEYN